MLTLLLNLHRTVANVHHPKISVKLHWKSSSDNDDPNRKTLRILESMRIFQMESVQMILPQRWQKTAR